MLFFCVWPPEVGKYLGIWFRFLPGGWATSEPFQADNSRPYCSLPARKGHTASAKCEPHFTHTPCVYLGAYRESFLQNLFSKAVSLFSERVLERKGNDSALQKEAWAQIPRLTHCLKQQSTGWLLMLTECMCTDTKVNLLIWAVGRFKTG